jgi:hypothetical protein
MWHILSTAASKPLRNHQIFFRCHITSFIFKELPHPTTFLRQFLSYPMIQIGFADISEKRMQTHKVCILTLFLKCDGIYPKANGCSVCPRERTRPACCHRRLADGGWTTESQGKGRISTPSSVWLARTRALPPGNKKPTCPQEQYQDAPTQRSRINCA